MASSLVDRATSSMLIGPDWAMNTEICDILNRDLAQAKDVVKRLKKRIKSKNPKVQLLALTLLETVMKGCGDVVHTHVAEKNILQEMVKLVKKKQDFHVKEKALVLIDTWQEGFGGPRARYPQFYAAYQELLHAGAVFPQRPERSSSIFTPQSQPLSSNQQSRQNPDYQQGDAESSNASDFPILSLSEIHNARGIMDVLAEMLNALDPANREGLRQEVIVDLVEQCRVYKKRLVHLVNTTADEELLSLGLALNDDLQRVLAKHDAIAAGIVVRDEKPKPPQALVDIGDADTKNGDTSLQKNGRASTGTATGSESSLQQLLLPAPPSSNEKSSSVTASANIVSSVDLMSWDDVSAPAIENSLALVPTNEPSPTSTSDQRALVLSDMFAQNNSSNGSPLAGSFDSNPSFYAPQIYSTTAEPQSMQVPQHALQPNGVLQNSGLNQFDQTHYLQGAPNPSNPMWNEQGTQSFNQQQQSINPGSNDQNGEGLPPPPWETYLTQENHPMNSSSQPIQNNQQGQMYPQVMQNPQLGQMHPQVMQTPQLGQMHPHALQNPQVSGFHSAPMQNGQVAGAYSYPMQGAQMAGMHLPHSQMQGSQLGGYAYHQQPEVQYYDPRQSHYPLASSNEVSQRMYGLSMQDNHQMSMNTSSYTIPSSSLPMQQPMKSSKPGDNLFGDLVNIAKTKQSKPAIK